MEIEPIVAHAPFPGAHLGLTWSSNLDVTPAELAALAAACRAADHNRLVYPPALLNHVFLPDSRLAIDLLGHFTLQGRARDGRLIAIGTVRIADEAEARVAVIQALVCPSWRGRGIGRALLSWQDAIALRILAGANEGARSVVGVPIQAEMIDRRRLYAAAGFSASTRIEMVAKRLGDSPPPDGSESTTELAPDWIARGLQPQDHESVARLLAEAHDPHAFLVRALTPREAVELADPKLSRVALHGGQVRGVILATGLHHGDSFTANLIGMEIQGADDSLKARFSREAHKVMWSHEVTDVVVPLTPAAARAWAATLASQSYRSIASDPIYTIELP